MCVLKRSVSPAAKPARECSSRGRWKLEYQIRNENKTNSISAVKDICTHCGVRTVSVYNIYIYIYTLLFTPILPVRQYEANT